MADMSRNSGGFVHWHRYGLRISVRLGRRTEPGAHNHFEHAYQGIHTDRNRDYHRHAVIQRHTYSNLYTDPYGHNNSYIHKPAAGSHIHIYGYKNADFYGYPDFDTKSDGSAFLYGYADTCPFVDRNCSAHGNLNARRAGDLPESG